MWYISFFGLVQYRIEFTNKSTAEKFSYVVNLWESSKAPREALGISVDAMVKHALKGHVSELMACQWDDEERAFDEIDILTSTFALFHGST